MARNTMVVHRHCGGRMSRSVGDASGICLKCYKRVTGDATEVVRKPKKEEEVKP